MSSAAKNSLQFHFRLLYSCYGDLKRSAKSKKLFEKHPREFFGRNSHLNPKQSQFIYKKCYIQRCGGHKVRENNQLVTTFIESRSHTVWKNTQFSLTKNFFREISSLVNSLVKTLLSRNICQKCVRVNFRIFHRVSQICNFSSTQ